MEFSDLELDDYPSCLKLYNSSFPPDERREYKDAEHLAEFIKMKGGKFRAFAVKDGDLFSGFLSYWIFEGYTYVEHFAVVSEMRGKNIGTKMLNHLFKTVSNDVLLEVEPPESPEAQRRIKFYERNGFRIRDEIDYMQPPYSKGQKPVKLLIMTHGDVSLYNKDSISEMLHEVYNVEKEI